MGNCIKAIAPLFILFLLIVASTPGVSQSQSTKVVAVSAGFFHSAALCDDGTVRAWGRNYEGQLGDGESLTDMNGAYGEADPAQVYVGTQTGPAHVHTSSSIWPSPEPTEFYVDMTVTPINASAKVTEKWNIQNEGRLDKNKNRTSVMDYVSQNPGSTLYEISRGMGMNKGTVRYHLFILGVNHRITSHSDGKFVRYFLNSNTFSKEDRMIISLIRRDTTKKVMQALLEKPGMTSAELGKTLGQPDSAIRKHLNELCAKGIAARENISDSRYSYSIKAEHVAHIESLMKNHGGGKAPTTPVNYQAEA